MIARSIRVEIPLPPTDRASLAAQQSAAPPGHFVIGPASAPPYWACATCGATWADGTHPALRSRRPFAEALASALAESEAVEAEAENRPAWWER